MLAQQTVAAVAMDTLSADEWFATVRRADPFRTLPRSLFDATLDMLAGKYPSDAFAQFRPRLIWDRDSSLITPRPGAQHLAVTSGGTIPDRGSFSVMLPEGKEQAGSRRVGKLDEEMVYESRVNDIITLGATSWRIQQITHDQVVVVPAPGRSARLPFWRGDGLGRSALLGEHIGRFLRETEPENMQGMRWMDHSAQHNIHTLLAEQREATDLVPTDRYWLSAAAMRRVTGASYCIRRGASACMHLGRWPWQIAFATAWGWNRRLWQATTVLLRAFPIRMAACLALSCSSSTPIRCSVSSPKPSVTQRCLPHAFVNARRARCSCRAAIPANVRRCGSSGCAPENCWR